MYIPAVANAIERPFIEDLFELEVTRTEARGVE
jgi:hypothetical protein